MEPGTAAWWAARAAAGEPPRRPRAGGLTLDRILDAALEVVDRDGLEALTVRRLAELLGTTHPALYRHVGSQHEIVVLLVDRVLGGVSLDPAPGGGPRARAERALRDYRAALLAHPALTPAFLSGQLLGPNALARREEALRLLLDGGVPPDLAVRSYLTLTHFVITSAVFESSGAARSVASRREMRELFAGLPPDRYPAITSLAAELNEPDGDEEFEFGLAALLDHVEAVAAAGSRRVRPPS